MSQGFDRSAYIGAFREEMDDHLQALVRGLLALERNPDDLSPVADVFRRAHTIKGAARMMGFDEVADLAHSMEDVLDDVRGGRLVPHTALLDALLTSLDLLGDLVKRPLEADSGPRADLDETIRWLRELRDPSASVHVGAHGVRPEPGDPSAPMDVGAHGVPPQRGATTTHPENHSDNGRRLAATQADTVRVDVRRIDSILNLAGELTVLDASRRQWTEDVGVLVSMVDAVGLAARRGDLPAAIEEVRRVSQAAARTGQTGRRLISQETEMVHELHHQVSFLRLLPIRTIFSLLPRAARDLARESDKEIELVVEGEDTQVDREVLELVRDALLHLVRNAVDHGIEAPEERVAAGKPRGGRVRLAAVSHSEMARVEIEDDGAGVDFREVREAAVRRGMVSRAQSELLDEGACLDLLFTSGFSTRDRVNDTSGRGVGLDVVRADLAAVRGRAWIETERGLGTKVVLEFPITRAFTHVLLVEVGHVTCAVRCSAVLGIQDLSSAAIRTLQGHETIEYGGRTVPLVWMDIALGFAPGQRSDARRLSTLLLGPQDRPIAFVVDRVVGDDNVIIKPLGPLLRVLRCLSGGFILGDGRVALKISVPYLLDSVRTVMPPTEVGPSQGRSHRGMRVLVVDDSAITRQLQRGILEAAGYQVETAVDGEDALQKIRSQQFAIVVTDVQMPRLDGIQLTATIKGDRELSRLPVVMVTSRESEEDKRRGMQVGADAYVGKGSFDQVTLLDTIERLLG